MEVQFRLVTQLNRCVVKNSVYIVLKPSIRKEQNQYFIADSQLHVSTVSVGRHQAVLLQG